MSAYEFNELKVLERHETLDRDGWKQTAEICRRVTGFTKTAGQTLDPLSYFMPTIPWPTDPDDEETH